MKTYKGFVKVPIKTFKDWRNTVIGNAYDMDGKYGYQCYDLANLFWKNATGRTCKSATKDGGIVGGASGIWGAREQNNKGNEFILINDYKKLKKGDIIITNNGKYGHVCWLDQDYDSNTYLRVLGQNQGGTGGELPGAKVKDIDWAFRKYFLGAFRFRVWHITPTKGVYKCLFDMNLRKSPAGTKVKVKDCTDAMKDALTSKKPNDNAVIKKGTNFTALDVVKSGSSYWAKNYSGYICIKDSKNEYCTKV